MVHKTEDITLEQLQKHLHIEEESCLRENKNVQSDCKVHHLEAGTSNNSSLKPKKNKGKFKNDNGKKKDKCHMCGIYIGSLCL